MQIGFILDILILFGLLGGILLGLRRGLAKMLLSTLMLFLATVFAALLYYPLINLFAGLGGGAASQRTGAAIVFFGLLVVFYAVLEYALHRNYPHMKIRALGNADNILGAIVGIVWAVLGMSLIVLIASYSAATVGGQASLVNDMVSTSALTTLLRKFFKLPVSAIRLLFPTGLPEVLAFFAL